MVTIHNDAQERLARCETWDDLLSVVESGLRDDGFDLTADTVKAARQQLEIEDEDSPRCPWCSVRLTGDTSVLPHNAEEQPYCSGVCYERDTGSESPSAVDDGERECARCDDTFRPGESGDREFCSSHCKRRYAGEECGDPGCQYCKDDKVK